MHTYVFTSWDAHPAFKITSATTPSRFLRLLSFLNHVPNDQMMLVERYTWTRDCRHSLEDWLAATRYKGSARYVDAVGDERFRRYLLAHRARMGGELKWPLRPIEPLGAGGMDPRLRVMPKKREECAPVDDASAKTRRRGGKRGGARRREKERRQAEREAEPTLAELRARAPRVEDVTCSITYCFYEDPVRLSGDGQVYSREAITAWLRKNNTSPLHGTELDSQAKLFLSPAPEVAVMVAAYLAAYPEEANVI